MKCYSVQTLSDYVSPHQNVKDNKETKTKSLRMGM